MEVTKAMEKGVLANNQLAMRYTGVVAQDMYALDINNDEWIRFETLMGRTSQGHALSVAPVSRERWAWAVAGMTSIPTVSLLIGIGDWGVSTICIR